MQNTTKYIINIVDNNTIQNTGKIVKAYTYINQELDI